ncbi:MAG: PhzF family phenazine biosynthesis protein [Burkholderiaceae bacterium]|nr:PhzF family phenazine biosynthesis protein [Burkholderiaceae bacterium]
MPTIRYRLLNVFAESTFGGNPLAVVEDGTGLSDVEMQLITRQFNLSETTFLLPPSSPHAAARVRIFTPGFEMPFAGHPTLGSAHVVRELFQPGDAFELEMKAGLIPVRHEQGRWTLLANPPSYRETAATPAELADMLGLPVEAIAGPAMWVSCGAEQLIIPLASVEHVRTVRPDPALLQKHGRNTKGEAQTYVFARTADGFEVRFFWMTDASKVSEDPGTGSACANLGGWWLKTTGNEPLSAKISQGAAMDRPNLLTLDVKDGKIHVGGRVISLGAGELHW